MRIFFLLFLLCALMQYPLLADEKSKSLQEELGIRAFTSGKKVCTVYLVNQGSTEWTETKRLQGWSDIPLNAKGREEVEKTGDMLCDRSISAIYSSPLLQAIETAQILRSKCQGCPLTEDVRLKGEYHGKFEGYTAEQCSKEPHVYQYRSLPPDEEIFFPFGEEGESKADVARRMVPAIKEICAAHLGENVVIVTHGGLFKLLNFYLGSYSERGGTVSVPHGSFMVIQGDAGQLFLK
jgi:broad specificity phosphatase PhoE